ncbi:MAG TPA: cation:proton antiporter [Bryobacteraceae bacterium]|nr:cation:proton antiporter [Bryobacteraceae bacterium]
MEETAAHVTQALLALGGIILAAKTGGEIFSRLKQPPVLGELLAGVILGNLSLFGITAMDPLKSSGSLHVLAEIGAILLLFEVGVESDLLQLLAVGWSSLVVAALGVIAPMVLGYFGSSWLLPEASWMTHLFIGGTLTATSVGITARVLKDLKKSATKEARIILGAAVADDVIGLVVMAVVSGLAGAAGRTGGEIGWAPAAIIIARAAGFLAVAVVAGRFWSQRVFRWAAKLQVAGALISVCICFCFLMAALAAVAGLAPIVGAFCAGVVLEDVHYQPFSDRGERKIEELLYPITTLIVPVFFVVMGMSVDVRGFGDTRVLGFAAVITLLAVTAKQICGLGVLEKGVDRIVIGIGMIPRGEVGLIFAALGSSLVLNGQPVLQPPIFSALVLMVILTTLLTPPLLKLAFQRLEL